MSSEVNDFSISAYRTLVRYAVTNFKQATFTSLSSDRSVIWRHDCDYSLLSACNLGRIDEEEGMVSSFFINIHSDTYNALSESGRYLVNDLLQQGHEIGIHLDVGFYGGIQNETHLEEILIDEKSQYVKFFGVTPTAFSFHQPTERDFQFQSETYAELINCYSSKYRNVWRYTSDSNGYWRHSPIFEVLNSDDCSPLQVLTHGEWWSENSLEPRERLIASLLRQLQNEVERYDLIMKQHKRENKSEIRETLSELIGIDRDLHLILGALHSLGFKEEAAAIYDRGFQRNHSNVVVTPELNS
jgi:hypothetical protein